MKISSEAAGTIALMPVIIQELSLDELIGRIASVSGKDFTRIRELLDSGTVVNGNSRLRWERPDVDAEDFGAAVRRLPDPDPSRRFSPAACVQLVARGQNGSVAISKEAGSKRRLLRRSSFWETMVNAVPTPEYVTYSYPDRADVYRVVQSAGTLERALKQLAYRAVASRIRAVAPEEILFYCTR